MKSTVANGAKVWFLASGTKKIGPLSESRVLERLAEGKVSPKVKAWKEGMPEWTPVGSIPEFSRTTRTLGIEEEAAPAPARRSRSGSGSRLVARREAPAAFVQPYRIERADLWRAFEMGFDLPRVKVALAAFAGLLAVAVFTLAAAWVSVILGAIAALAAVPVCFGVTAVAMGALSYQTRRAVETGTTPDASEALGFAKQHALALVVSPVLVSLLALAPPVALVIKSLVSRIPTIGPPAAGLTFGVDLALSSLTLFLAVAASLAWHFVPSIVACEEQGALGTVRALLGIVRSRIARIILWPGKASSALSALALALVLLAAVVTVVPAALNSSALGVNVDAFTKRAAPSFERFDTSEDSPHALAPRSLAPRPNVLSTLTSAFEPGVGLVGVAIWTAVLFAIVAAVLVSTANALVGLLYLACRPGNDDLITRDDWLAQRQGGLHASN